MNFKNSFVATTMQIAGLTLCLAATSLPACAQAPSPADWTEFHRDNMQRWNPYETTIGVNNIGNLGLKWAAFIGTPTPSVVANGVAYVGTIDGAVYALNASTGTVLWSNEIGGILPSSPAVANGVVYIGSFDHNVYALNASTGAKLWSFTTGDQVESSPTVANGVVYIGSDALYALNASTGAKLWSYPAGVSSSPAVVNGWSMSGAVPTCML